jgi:hypothetical protein
VVWSFKVLEFKWLENIDFLNHNDYMGFVFLVCATQVPANKMDNQETAGILLGTIKAIQKSFQWLALLF